MALVRCEYCRGEAKNAMGVPCRSCKATGKVEVADATPATSVAKASALRGEDGGFVRTSGRPRYAYFQGKHLVVGRGRAEEFPTLAEAYRRRDELLRG